MVITSEMQDICGASLRGQLWYLVEEVHLERRDALIVPQSSEGSFAAARLPSLCSSVSTPRRSCCISLICFSLSSLCSLVSSPRRSCFFSLICCSRTFFSLSVHHIARASSLWPNLSLFFSLSDITSLVLLLSSITSLCALVLASYLL